MIYNTKRAAPQYSFKQNGRYQLFEVAAERKMAYLQIGSDNILRWEKAPSYNSFYYTHTSTLSIAFIGIYVMAIWYRFQTLSWKEANWIGCHCHVIIANRAKVNLFLLSHKLLSGFLMVVILVYASFPKKIRGLLFRNMVALSSCDDDGKMGIKSHGNIKTSRLSSTLDNDSRLNIFHRNFSLISIKHVHVCSLGCLGLIS